MKKFTMEPPMEVSEVEKAVLAYNSTPVGMVQDADTILADILASADTDETGIGADILELWLDASETERSVVEAVFYGITGTEFREYVERCVNETTRPR